MSDVLARQAGVIINPNKELLFNSVSLREFGFSFVFTARGQDEVDEIKKIIHAFKKYSAPKTGSKGFFLDRITRCVSNIIPTPRKSKNIHS